MPIAPNGTWVPYETANFTGMWGMFDYANTVTDGLFGPLMLLAIFIVTMAVQRNRSVKESLPVSCFITAILAVMMKVGGLVPNEAVIALIVATAVSMLFSMTD